MEGPCGKRATGDGDPGGHFPLGSVPASGRAHSAWRGNSLGSAEAEVPGLCTLLCLPGDRVFCRGGVRRLVQMVEKGVPATASVGFADFGRALEEVNAGMASLTGPTTRSRRRLVRNRPDRPPATPLLRSGPRSFAQSCLR